MDIIPSSGTIPTFFAEHNYSPDTRSNYERILRELVLLPSLNNLTAPDLLKFVDRPTWGNSQQYLSLGACRAYLTWRFGKSHPALMARIRRARPKRQRTLTADQALNLLASFPSHTAKGSRDLAIAALALDTGLRCSELCRLRLDDTDLVQRNLQVIVKGGQWSTAVFSTQTSMYISDWLNYRKPNAPNLFVSIRFGQALTRCGLRVIFQRWGKRIGIRLSPHDLRRSFATLSTIYGAPSRIVQVAGRWADITMVERYTQALEQSAITPYLPVTHLLNK